MPVLASALLLLIIATAVQPFSGSPHRIAWADRGGQVLDVIGEPQWTVLYTAISPDATKVAVRGQDVQKANPYVWIFDVARGTRARLTAHVANEGQPAWSPNGDRIAYLSYRNGLGDLFIRNADGSGDDLPLTSSPDLHEFAPSWSPDGRFIVFHTQDPKTNDRNVMYVSVDRGREPMVVSDTPAQEALGSFSADGRYIAYGSNETGQWEVYVRSFPAGEGPWKVSTNGGVWPKWDWGRGELYFFEGTNLIAASVSATGAFSVRARETLFSAEQVGMDPAAIRDFNPTYDVARGGEKFVVVQRVQ